MKSIQHCNVLICGAGIIGLTLAKKLVDNGISDILIIEKEEDIGKHASGRNSGVLHAGIYYAKDSMKAQFCLKGNKMMKEYCRENDIPVHETGKVIVCKDESEIETLEMLYNRAIENGAKVDLIDEKELKDIEPKAKTVNKAIYSHYTAVVDPKQIINQLKKELIESNKVKFLFNHSFLSTENSDTIVTDKSKIQYNFFCNAAGAYSDIVAHSFNLAKCYKLIPFKGIYYKLDESKNNWVNGNIYPVPDVRNPFLGVHYTKNIYGDVYLGPTAIPAFGRSNYSFFEDISSETLSILKNNFILFFNNSKYRDVALTEPKKYWKHSFFGEAKKLAEDVQYRDIHYSTKAGIRPQLVYWPKKELVMDYLVIEDDRSLHFLNTISPAFTSSFAFIEYIFEENIKDRFKSK